MSSSSKEFFLQERVQSLTTEAFENAALDQVDLEVGIIILIDYFFNMKAIAVRNLRRSATALREKLLLTFLTHLMFTRSF